MSQKNTRGPQRNVFVQLHWQFQIVLFISEMFYIIAKMQTISAYISLTKQNNSGRFCGHTNKHKSTNNTKYDIIFQMNVKHKSIMHNDHVRIKAPI